MAFKKLKKLFEKAGPLTARARFTDDTTDVAFTVEPGLTLLRAALQKEHNFPYRCRVGSCGTCKVKLDSGDIIAIKDFSFTLSEEDIKAGYILACQTRLKSDINVEVTPRPGRK